MTNDVTIKKERFMTGLLKIGAIQFGQFTLVSGRISPYYIDLRALRSSPYMLDTAQYLLWEMISQLSFDKIADVPTAGTPLASAMVIPHNVSMITPRKPKKHGTKASIDGIYKSGETVVLVDDLITSASSKLEAIKILEDSDLKVEDVCVLVDRNQGGREALAEAGYQLHASLTIKDIISYYRIHKPRGILVDQIEEVERYLEDPGSFRPAETSA